MTQKVKPIPEGSHTLTPYLVVNGAAKAIDFYKQAFNAKELTRHEMPDGQIMHAQLKIGDSIIMLSDEFPNTGCNMSAPGTLKGTTMALHMYVEDVDQAFAQAVKAGGVTQMEVNDTFWGDRYGQLLDPFGHVWSIASQKEILTPEQVEERAAKFFAEKH